MATAAVAAPFAAGTAPDDIMVTETEVYGLVTSVALLLTM